MILFRLIIPLILIYIGFYIVFHILRKWWAMIKETTSEPEVERLERELEDKRKELEETKRRKGQGKQTA